MTLTNPTAAVTASAARPTKVLAKIIGTARKGLFVESEARASTVTSFPRNTVAASTQV